MKHLKSYKLFENIDDTIKYFQDILLELSDENFNIRVKEDDHHVYRKCINVVISKDGGDFDFWTERNIGELTPIKFIQIKDDILRLLEYAYSEGWYSFSFEVITPTKETIKGSSFNDGTYRASVKIEGDEILYPHYDVETNKKVYNPISDDEKILCVYIGLGK
jgi:hypothetical protein